MRFNADVSPLPHPPALVYQVTGAWAVSSSAHAHKFHQAARAHRMENVWALSRRRSGRLRVRALLWRRHRTSAIGVVTSLVFVCSGNSASTLSFNSVRVCLCVCVSVSLCVCVSVCTRVCGCARPRMGRWMDLIIVYVCMLCIFIYWTCANINNGVVHTQMVWDNFKLDGAKKCCDNIGSNFLRIGSWEKEDAPETNQLGARQ